MTQTQPRIDDIPIFEGRIGFDIDGTITGNPQFFSALSRKIYAACGKIHVVSCRSPLSYKETERELRDLGVKFSRIYLLPNFGHPIPNCQDRTLNWYEKYIWQKVEYALAKQLSHFFDDDPAIQRLFRKYAPQISLNPCSW